MQWNARTLTANQQEVEEKNRLGIQETWLKPHLDFVYMIMLVKTSSYIINHDGK